MSLNIKHIGIGKPAEIIDAETYIIRYDDTIDTIKEKIILKHGWDITADSIYLFTKVSKNVSSQQVFRELAKSRNKYNILTGKDINVLKKNCNDKTVSNKKRFKYKDFKKEFGNKNKECYQPLGHSIFYKDNYAIVTNPYDLISQGDNKDENKINLWDEFLFSQNNNKSLIKYSGQKLLFEFLNPEDDNIIFYCTAIQYWNDIQKMDKINRTEDFYKYILQIYFPYLFYIKNIDTYEKVIGLKQVEAKQEEKGKNYKKLNHFYDFYNEKKEYGLITSINFSIHMTDNVNIPMDLIFKILHSDIGMPMIKFNPGRNRENIFRLYTKDYISKNGLKLPYLYVKDNKGYYKIKNISKVLALQASVGIYMITECIEIYCELHPNGSINIKIQNIELEKEKLDEIIQTQINENILYPINQFIKKTGFSYREFKSLTDDNIEIKNMKYRYKFEGFLPRENFKLSNWLKAINQIYRVKRGNFKTNGKLDFQYIKVSSYKKSDDLQAYIINYMHEFGQGVEIDKELIELLVENFKIKKEEAIEEIRKSKENLALNLTVYSSKKIEIRDSPGFKVTLFKDLKNTIIEYENINNYNYLKHIDVYTTYLYHKFLNVKNKAVTKLLIEKFGKSKEIPIKNDPVNPKEQKKAEEIQDDNDGIDHGQKYASADEEDSDSDDDDESSDDEDLFAAAAKYGGGESESSEEEEDVYGNLENIRLKGANSYFSNKIKKEEPYLYAKRTGKTFSFATSCPANFSRTPVLITKDEKKIIDDLDKESGFRSYDEYITSDKGNHFICPRFWCLSDKKAPNGRSLSFQQVNEGECGGWPSVIRKNEKPSNKKRIYEFTDEKYHFQKPGNNFMYRQHYPGWSRKNVSKIDGTGQEDICIPCCYNTPREEYQPEDWEISKRDDGKSDEFKYWKTAPMAFQRQNDPNNKKGTSLPLETKDEQGNFIGPPYPIGKIQNLMDENFVRARKIPKKNNMRSKEYKTCDGSQGKGEVKERKTIEYMSIPIIETFPLKFPGQLGYLPLSVQKLFNYNIVTQAWLNPDRKPPNTKLKPNKWVLVRLGMKKNDILSCIGNIYKYYKATNKNEKNYENVEITSDLVDGDREGALDVILNWLEFYGFELQSGKKIKRLYNPNQPNEISEYKKKISDTTLKKFLSMNRGNLYQMFKTKKGDNRKDAIINFIKYIYNDSDKDTKAQEILWDIITTPISEGGAFFEKGVNLIILKKPKEDILDKIDVVCPNNNFFKTKYDVNRPTIILYTDNNMYEPIYMIKRPEKRSKTGWPIIKMFKKEHVRSKDKYKIKNSRFSDFIIKVIEKINLMCVRRKGLKDFDKLFEPNKKLNELLDVNKNNSYKILGGKYTIKNEPVAYQLYNEDYQVIALVVDTIIDGKIKDFILPCEPSSIFNNINMIRYEKYVNNVDNLLDRNTTEKLIDKFNLTLSDESKRNVVREGLIIGIRTKTNQIIPIKPTRIEEGEIINYIDELEEYKTDTKIFQNYPYQDKQREDTIKKIKLESNFYLMYRNLFKILINKEEWKEEKDRLMEILYEVFDKKDDKPRSYVNKVEGINEIVKKIINIYIEWTKIPDNINADDLINCLDLNESDCDKKPACLKKEGDQCKFIFPENNLLYENIEKKNEHLYSLKLTDEIIRYEKIREYVLKNDIFLNFDQVEYKIYDDEIVILENMFLEIYDKNIKAIYKSEYITNYKLYDNIQDERDIKKYKYPLTLKYTDSDVEYISESESESDSDQSVGVVEEKVERPKTKTPKAKTPKAKKKKGKIYDSMRKFVSFLMWYEFLKENEKIDKNMSIDDFKNIDIVKKWIQIAETKVKVKRKGELKDGKKLDLHSGLNTIQAFGLSDDWEKSPFKDYKLNSDEKMSSWEEKFKKKYPEVINAGKMNNSYMKGPDRFFRHLLSKSKNIETLDELLEHFKTVVIYTAQYAKLLVMINDE